MESLEKVSKKSQKVSKKFQSGNADIVAWIDLQPRTPLDE